MSSDTDARDAEFEAQVRALRRHFLEGLPARHQVIAAAWAGCLAGAGEASWQSLRDGAHRLSGSAACYGLDALGEQARELDALLSGRTPCRDAGVAGPVATRLLAAIQLAIGSD